MPLTSFRLADGREAVLLGTVLERETVTARFIIAGRDAWFRCAAPVQYAIDWSVRMTREGSSNGR